MSTLTDRLFIHKSISTYENNVNVTKRIQHDVQSTLGRIACAFLPSTVVVYIR